MHRCSGQRKALRSQPVTLLDRNLCGCRPGTQSPGPAPPACLLQKVKAMFLVSGWTKGEGAQHVVRVVDGVKLEAAKSSLGTITAMHVYSVAPGVPKVRQGGRFARRPAAHGALPAAHPPRAHTPAALPRPAAATQDTADLYNADYAQSEAYFRTLLAGSENSPLVSNSLSTVHPPAGARRDPGLAARKAKPAAAAAAAEPVAAAAAAVGEPEAAPKPSAKSAPARLGAVSSGAAVGGQKQEAAPAAAAAAGDKKASPPKAAGAKSKASPAGRAREGWSGMRILQ